LKKAERQACAAIYDSRRFVDGHPDIQRRELDLKEEQMSEAPSRIPAILHMLGRLGAPLETGAAVAVVGCGPRPDSVVELSRSGYRVTGIEPGTEYVARAQMHVGTLAMVALGSAEALPLRDQSQSVLLLESVLEHVDSVSRALEEASRVLVPGGVLYIKTTNRWMLTNGEFTSRFYQWYPPLLKESYVYTHIHFRPELARHTSRPAVHWFTFAELCSRGREAGFHRFYSPLDLLSPSDPEVGGGRVGGILVRLSRSCPLLRAAALTQRAGSIVFMVKR
jgi:SAM-dependent methyltransferase